MKRIIWTAAAILMLIVSVFGQMPIGNHPGYVQGKGNDDDEGPLQVGYAIVTTVSGSAKDLVVFETFGMHRANETTQAGLMASDMTSSAVMFVSANSGLARNLGVGIANPGNADAEVTLTLRDEKGVVLATKISKVLKQSQTAQFVTEMFDKHSDLLRDLMGTLNISSTQPVGIVGLRFRGENFSTLPVTNLSTPSSVPQREPGVGGAGAVLLPHFAAGGGWSTELILANVGTGDLKVRADLYKQDGSAMKVKLNGGDAQSSYNNLSIPKGGVLVLSPKDTKGNSPF